MNYIIDPSVFYWINTLNNISTACVITSVLTGIASIALILGYVFKLNNLNEPDKPENEDDEWEMRTYIRYLNIYNKDKKYANIFRNWCIITIIISFITLLGALFIPNKTASVEMLVAKTATFDNVDWTVQQVKEIIDYIVNALKTIT